MMFYLLTNKSKRIIFSAVEKIERNKIISLDKLNFYYIFPRTYLLNLT